MKPLDKSQLSNVNIHIVAIGGGLEINVNLQNFDKNKTWKYQYVQTDEKQYYSVCSFMKQLFVIGGWFNSKQTILRSCYTYNL